MKFVAKIKTQEDYLEAQAFRTSIREANGKLGPLTVKSVTFERRLASSSKDKSYSGELIINMDIPTVVSSKETYK